MKLKIFLLIALTILGLCGLGRAAAPNEALVTEVRGTVTMKGKPLAPATRLEKGARLEVAQGGSVTLVYLTDAHKETLSGPGVLTVGGKAQGQVQVASGPGAITKQPTGNSKGAVASVRGPDRTDLTFEQIRTGADGNSELIFGIVSESTADIMVEVYPYDPSTNSPGEKLLDSAKSGQRVEVEHGKPLPTRSEAHAHVVVPLKIKLEPEVPYRLLFTDSKTMDFEQTHRWIIALSPEHADALLEMQRWAYAQPQSVAKFLSFAQIAYEWQDYGAAVNAAYEAHNLSHENQEATETYRKLLYLNQQEGAAKDLQ